MHAVQALVVNSKAGGPSPAVPNMGIILHFNQGHSSCAQTPASQTIPSDILDSKQELGAAPCTYHFLLLVLMSCSPSKLKATSIFLASNRLQGLSRGSSSLFSSPNPKISESPEFRTQEFVLFRKWGEGAKFALFLLGPIAVAGMRI